MGLIIEFVGLDSLLQSDKWSQNDINRLIKEYKQSLSMYFEERCQKNQIRMLIESMQTFIEEAKDSGDSPSELLKDIFMHLIQEEKHKFFSQDDWFQVINAMH